VTRPLGSVLGGSVYAPETSLPGPLTEMAVACRSVSYDGMMLPQASQIFGGVALASPSPSTSSQSA